MKGKITSKAENSNDAGKQWFTIGIDGKSYSTFDKKLYDKCAIGEEVNYTTVQKGKYTNLESMWKEGEAVPNAVLAKEATAQIFPRIGDAEKNDLMRRANANNNGTLVLNILQQEGHLDGRNAKEIMEIKMTILKLEEEYLQTGKMSGIELLEKLFKAVTEVVQ